MDISLRYDGGVHNQLIEALLASSIPGYQSIGYMLRDCKSKRTKADYNLTTDFDLNDARIQLGNVKRLIAKLDELDQDEFVEKAS